ncbi:MAG: anti-sigma regulatory factor [bacterium]
MNCNTSKIITIPISHEHQIQSALHAALKMAGEMGFSETWAFYVATSVSELASNLIFHATNGGQITMTAVERPGAIGMELTAEDTGPGIPDLELALQDNFSTNGGLGSGLPGVNRLMDEFEITSQPGLGTRVVVRKWKKCR